MKKLDMSEYDPEKKYPEGTEFELDDMPPEIPVPEFLKDEQKKED